MPSFSRQSLHQLRSCDPRLQALFARVVVGYDCTIICGHRGEEAQNKAFREGRSKLQFPEGNHNEYPSKATDAAPYPVRWGGPLLEIIDDGQLVPYTRINQTNLQALRRFYHFAGYVLATAREMNIPIRWGGDWDSDNDLDDQTFNDLVHFEIDEEAPL